jgi:hypothetical protein
LGETWRDVRPSAAAENLREAGALGRVEVRRRGANLGCDARFAPVAV